MHTAALENLRRCYLLRIFLLPISSARSTSIGVVFVVLIMPLIMDTVIPLKYRFPEILSFVHPCCLTLQGGSMLGDVYADAQISTSPLPPKPLPSLLQPPLSTKQQKKLGPWNTTWE